MLRLALLEVSNWHREVECATASRVEAIRLARTMGATWGEIGETMGMSRQMAHKRFVAAVGESENGDTSPARKATPKRLEDYATAPPRRPRKGAVTPSR